MNQDQDFNKDDRREGERRSVSRRDDGPRATDRPRIDGPRNTGPREGGFNRDRDDKPRYGDRKEGGPRAGGPREGGYNRVVRHSDDKPRYGDRKEGGPRQGSFSRDRDDKPRFGDRKEGGPREGGYKGARPSDRSSSSQDSYPRPAGDRDNGTRKPYVKRDGDSREGGYGRGNDRRNEGGRSNDRPSFDRDRRSDGPHPTNSDRFGSERRFEERDSKPREGGFNRDRNRTDGPDSPRKPYVKREGGSSEGGASRFGNDRRDDNRGSAGGRDSAPREGGFNRVVRHSDRDDKPRYSDRKEGGPRQGSPREGGFNRDRDDSKAPFRPDGDRKPRFDRDDRRDSAPREGSYNKDRTDKPRYGGPRDNDRRDGAPRENRFGDKPAFDRRDAAPRDDRPREGGFKREERKFTPRDEQSSDTGSSKPRDNEFDKRFSDDQREDSRGRQVGKFKRAPDYNKAMYPKPPSFDKKGSDKKPSGNRFEKPRSERNAGPRPTEPREVDDRDPSGLMRLNRYIANAGVCSRREADELIGRGDIMVNGKVVTEMGYKVQETDIVKYGKTTLNPEKLVYVLLNKPKDYLTTTEDPEERHTVMELVADAGNYRIYPVGRLDRNTTGLLLMTNDGELADKLTHPSNNVRKIYQAELDKPITEEHFEAIKAGVELEDGMIKPDELALVTPDAYVVGIEIHSGRNRIVRRIFENFGYEVTKLDRTIYAGLTKKELPRGKWRFLEPKEVIKLKYLN